MNFSQPIEEEGTCVHQLKKKKRKLCVMTNERGVETTNKYFYKWSKNNPFNTVFEGTNVHMED